MTPSFTPLAVPLALAEIRQLCATGAARSIREDAGLSLREIADHLGVGVTTISVWERNEQRPTGDRALRYHQLLLELANRRAFRVVPPAART